MFLWVLFLCIVCISSFLKFYFCCHLPVSLIERKKRRGIELGGSGGGEQLDGVGEGKTHDQIIYEKYFQ